MSKELEEFSKAKGGRFGRNSQCKQCKQLAIHEWRTKNAEHIKAYAAEYYNEEQRQKRHQRYLATKETVNQRARKWRENNIDRSRQISRESHARHRDKLRTYDRIRYEADHQYFSQKNRRWRQAHPLERAATESRRRAQMTTSTIHRVDYAAILKRDNTTCHICGKKVSKDQVSFDHLIPLCKGGPHTMTNIRVAHKRCNFRRGPGRIPAQLLLFA